MDMARVDGKLHDLAAADVAARIDLRDHVGGTADDVRRVLDLLALFEVELAVDLRLRAELFDDLDERLDDGVGGSGDEVLLVVDVLGADAQRDCLARVEIGRRCSECALRRTWEAGSYC